MTQRVFFLTMAVTSLLMAQWGPDVRLTNDPAWSGTAYSNAWCVAATGDTVHVVWSDYRGGTAGIYYKRSLDRGTTWSADTRLDSSTANAVFPCLVAAGSTLHLAWTDYRNGNSETYYKRSTNAGASWSLDVRLTNDTFPTYTASVAVAGAYVHVVFGDWRSGNEEVYYKRSTDAGATWGPDTRLTNATGYSSYPAVAAGGNTVHVAWQDTRDGNYEIYYKRSITGGASWFTDVRLTANPTNSASAAIAAADSTVHVVWYDDLSGDYELYHKYSTDGGATWGPDLRLTTSPGRSIFHSLAAVGNEVHLVWEDERDGNQEVYYKRSTDRGLSWSADLRLTTSPDSSALPSIAFSGGTSHVVWSDRRNGNMEAYYKRGFVSDVGCTRIIAPLGNVDSGQVVTPRAWVRNFGTVTVSFGVRLSIGSSYTDSVTVSNLAGGDSMLLNFPAWTATQTGIHIVRCSTRLNGDVNPANDRRVDSVRVVTAPRPFDVGVTRIVAPFGDAEPGSTVSPTAAWRNFGDTVASFLAWFSLRNPQFTVVYNQLLPVTALPGGAETTLVFPPYVLDSAEGRWTTRCSTYYVEDMNRTNDTLSGSFTISAPPPWPDTWGEGEPMPAPSNKGIKDGGWLVVPPGLTDAPQYIFAAKGNKTSEFYRYTVATGTWTQAASIPLGREGKLPSKGCKAVANQLGYVYMTKGNNTPGFWRYDPSKDSWRQLADVPLGRSNKKVKDGNDLACFMKAGEQYVYLVKGQKTNEFWRYRVSGDSWSPLQAVPVDLPAIKTNAGSWLELVEEATDAHPYLYLHKSTYHHLHRYDLINEAWVPGRRTGMPFVGKSGRPKKSKDGGSATFWSGDIYALKGGNTCEFWKYSPATDQWTEQPSIPEIGVSGKKKRVKAGADVVSVGGGAFFVTKGNKTNECWRVVLQKSKQDGVTDAQASNGSVRLTIGPNPLRAGFATIRLSGQAPLGYEIPAKVSMYDAAGRLVLHSSFDNRTSSLPLDLQHLSAGVYLLRLEHKGGCIDRKLVVVSQ